MQVRFVADRADLARLAPEWQALAARAVEPNPFYEAWMALAALDSFGEEAIAFATVRSGSGELVGLFPLRRAARHHGIPARTLCSWRHAHCLLGVPLLRADCAADVLRAFLAAARGEASVLDLWHLPAEGPFFHALVEALGEDAATRAEELHVRPLMRRGADAETYVRTMLSSDTRSELRRREKRLAEQGRLERRVLRPGDDVARWTEEFLALESSGWKGRRGSALACSEANRRFAAEVFRRGFERGRLAMVGIDLDGRPIARYSAFLGGAGAFAFKTAFDERLRTCAPGILAEVDMLRLLHETPGLEWADSYTDPANSTLGRFWKSRRAIQRLAVGLDAWGALALAVLPLAKWLKGRLGRRPRPQALAPLPGRQKILQA